uniref:Uncharacterized protein n=1 Tax=viral metagenome TaxID=1070528 RepID=A0A6M3KDB1_9ZZZZ
MCESNKAKQNAQKRTPKDYFHSGADIMWKAWNVLPLVEDETIIRLEYNLHVVPLEHPKLKLLNDPGYAAGMAYAPDDIYVQGWVRTIPNGETKIDIMEQILGHETEHIINHLRPDIMVNPDRRW